MCRETIAFCWAEHSTSNGWKFCYHTIPPILRQIVPCLQELAETINYRRSREGWIVSTLSCSSAGDVALQFCRAVQSGFWVEYLEISCCSSYSRCGGIWVSLRVLSGRTAFVDQNTVLWFVPFATARFLACKLLYGLGLGVKQVAILCKQVVRLFVANCSGSTIWLAWVFKKLRGLAWYSLFTSRLHYIGEGGK